MISHQRHTTNILLREVHCRFAVRTLTSSSKRRAKAKPRLRPTTRDRIRSLTDPPPVSLMVHANRAATFFELRLREAQAAVRGFWGREGTPASQQLAGRGTAQPSIVMDRWWWTWNLALALTPAALIVILMELWGKPHVAKRLKEVEEYQRQNLGMLEDDEEEDEVMVEQVHQPSPVLRSEPVSHAATTPRAAVEDPATPSIPTQSTSAAAADAPTELDTAALQQLVQRIQLLEHKLEQQTKKAEKQRKFQVKQSKQSGIQNRLQDKLILKERERVENEDVPLEADATPTAPSMWDVASVYMQQNLTAKRDAILQYGKEVVAGEPLSSSDSDERSKDAVTTLKPVDIKQTATMDQPPSSSAAAMTNTTNTDITNATSDDAPKYQLIEKKQSWWGSAFSRSPEVPTKKEP